MKHLTRFTRSFIYVLILSLGAAYLALMMATSQKFDAPLGDANLAQNHSGNEIKTDSQEADKLLPTGTWLDYQDAKYSVGFKYPKGWTVSPNADVSGYHTITAISPKKDKISIYISEKDFFAMNGLKTKPYSVNGYSGQRWNDSILAIKAGKYFYTFDASQNSKPIPEFLTMMSTLKFGN